MIISKIIMKRNIFYYSHSKFSSKSNKLHSVETKGRCMVDGGSIKCRWRKWRDNNRNVVVI